MTIPLRLTSPSPATSGLNIAPAGIPEDLPVSPADCKVEVLSVDERSALCLLALARDLLKSDHHAVAAMIDYAMVEVAMGQHR